MVVIVCTGLGEGFHGREYTLALAADTPTLTNYQVHEEALKSFACLTPHKPKALGTTGLRTSYHHDSWAHPLQLFAITIFKSPCEADSCHHCGPSELQSLIDPIYAQGGYGYPAPASSLKSFAIYYIHCPRVHVPNN